jgi:Family of unknown function (DUF5906)
MHQGDPREGMVAKKIDGAIKRFYHPSIMPRKPTTPAENPVLFSTVNVFRHKDVMRVLASPMIDHTKDGVYDPSLPSNGTRKSLIAAGFFDAVADYGSTESTITIEYRMPEKGVGRYVGYPYGYHSMSRVARNVLCAGADLLDFDLSSSHFRTWLWLGKTRNPTRSFPALEYYRTNKADVLAMFRAANYPSENPTDDQIKFELNRLANLDSSMLGPSSKSMRDEHGNYVFEGHSDMLTRYLASLDEELRCIHLLTKDRCPLWPWESERDMPGWGSYTWPVEDGKSPTISYFSQMTLELERLLIRHCMVKARELGATVVSYNQDGFILRRHAAQAALRALNEDLAPLFHELRVKPFSFDERLLAPEGAVPDDDQLIELFEGLKMFSVEQKCLIPRDAYWRVRTRFLKDHFQHRVTGDWHHINESTGGMTTQDILEVEKVWGRDLNRVGATSHDGAPHKFSFINYLTYEDRFLSSTSSFHSVAFQSDVPPGLSWSREMGGTILNIWRHPRAHYLPKAECPELIEMVKRVAFVVCGEVQELADHLLKTIAHRIQFPEKRINIALVVVGGQGYGKSTIFESIGHHVLGSELHFVSVNNIDSVFGKFNGRVEHRSMMLLNESRKELRGEHANDLKNMITDPTIIINPKGRESYLAKHNTLVCITSNDDDPVNIEPGDRRYFIVKSTGALFENFEFFGRYWELVKSDAGARAFYDFLMTLDLTGFNPQKMPASSIRTALLPSSRDPIKDFLIDMARLGQKTYQATELLGRYHAWARENEVEDDLNPTKFGRALTQIPHLVEKGKVGGVMVYTLQPALLALAGPAVVDTTTPSPSLFAAVPSTPLPPAPPTHPKPVAPPLATPVAPPLATPLATPPPAIPTATAPAIPFAIHPATTFATAFPTPTVSVWDTPIIAAPPPRLPVSPPRGMDFDYRAATTVEATPKFAFRS